MHLDANPRIGIAGSVNSSLRTLKKLVEYKCNLACVLGLHPDRSKNVSGYNDLQGEAVKNNIPFKYFDKINSDDIYTFVKDARVDLLFVVGLSQMVREPLLSAARYGIVGFHPTKLPTGRGRGAVAWIILGKAKGAATFFLMDEGMDSGHILGQQAFDVSENDYAEDVIEKIKLSIDKVLDRILPDLKNGDLELIPQDHSKATYIGQRKPKDGLITWNDSCLDIHKLIRATSRPLPGAFTYMDGKKIVIYRSTPVAGQTYTGVPGRVLFLENERPLVTCGEGALWLDEYESAMNSSFRVGSDLG